MSKFIKYGLYLLLITALFLVVYVVLIYYSVLSYERQFFISNSINDSVITVFRHGDTGVIIADRHTDIPDTNFVKIRQRSFFDESLYVCWDIDGYKWKIFIDRAEIVENRLDTLSFQFYNEYNKDEQGMPSIRPFDGDHCTSMLYVGPLIANEEVLTVEANWKLRIGSDRYRKEF